ncbi:unnamed protein product [Leptidea sinapis]|uniref:2'-phosphotransferase n=1 Tax=Leptidea sinapis TaxID=189913 RepID=A0A5E4PUC7_9NEOP|nr:unnamed protein product [Leptidea sinapis]
MNDRREVQLSKLLSWLLRHGANKEGLQISNDGYIAVSELLLHHSFRGKYNKSDIIRVVENNSKKRFKLRQNPQNNILEIKANQGHSIDINNTDLIQILEPKYQTLVHGTYFKYWPKIKNAGLHHMSRKHIHLSKALADGIRFYESENGVVLTEGNVNGYLEPKYFSKVTIVKTGKFE